MNDATSTQGCTISDLTMWFASAPVANALSRNVISKRKVLKVAKKPTLVLKNTTCRTRPLRYLQQASHNLKPSCYSKLQPSYSQNEECHRMLQSPLTMNYPEVERQQRRGSSSRGIWNPQEPAVAYSASFDHNIIAASTNLGASSTFLFPSSTSAVVCHDSITSPALGVVTGSSCNLQELKNHHYCKTMLEDHLEVSGTDQSRVGHESSFCTIDHSDHIISGSMTMDPLHQAWLSQSRMQEEQHQPEEVVVNAPHFDGYLQHYGGANAGHSFKSNKGENADHESLHDHPAGTLHNFWAPVQHNHEAFVYPFLPAQRTGLQRPDYDHHHLQLVTKFNHKYFSPSVQCGALASADKKILHKNMNEASLDSPCSVISGFTKALSSGTEYVDNSGTASTSASVQEFQQEGMSTTSHHHLPNYAVGEIMMSQHSRSTSESQMEPRGLTNSMRQNSTVQRAKRKRTRTRTRTRRPKQGDEVESQRMTHITVERNRRKQMNEHLATLRALMPSSYVQRGDQASIVGGAIEFVKELEDLLLCLQDQKRRRVHNGLTTAIAPANRPVNSISSHHEFRPQLIPTHSYDPATQGSVDHQSSSSFPLQPVPDGVLRSQRLGGQSSGAFSLYNCAPTATAPAVVPAAMLLPVHHPLEAAGAEVGGNVTVVAGGMGGAGMVGEARSEMANVEVRRVGWDAAVVKILTIRRGGQLLRTVVALESLLGLSVLHTNITTIHHTVLYSFHVSIGAKCRLSVEEMAAALHQTFTSVQSLQF